MELHTEQAYIAITPNKQYYFPSCSDEIELTKEYVTYHLGETWEYLKSNGWMIIDVEVTPN